MPTEALLASTAAMNTMPSPSGCEDPFQAKLPIASTDPKTEHRAVPFTQSQLCLAIIIQKSKPSDISTKDYFLQLQKHVRQGRLPGERAHRYIDTTEFWKDQCTKVYLEKIAMEVQLAQLEARLDPSTVDSRSAIFGPWPRVIAQTQQREAILNTAESANNLPLLRQALKLYRLLQDDDVTTDTLVMAIRSSLSYMNSAISNACRINGDHVDGSVESAGNVSLRTFDTVAAIFDICLKGLTHLCRDIPGRRCKGQVIFSLIQVFVKTLEHLNTMCLQQTSYQAPKIVNPQEKPVMRAELEELYRNTPLFSELTNFLIKILACPEFHTDHSPHVEVLEGIFSALLGEVGQVLSHIVFNELPPEFDGLATISCPNAGMPTSANSVSIGLKCMYLAPLLKRAIEGRPQRDKRSLVEVLAGSKVSENGAGKNVLLAQTRQRLQETLLKGMFGDDREEFTNALQVPGSGDIWDDEALQIPQDERHAFLELVWSSIGWDILLSDENKIGN